MRDKVALVTGAARGIGRATATELARRGAQLILCDVDGDALELARRDLHAHSRAILVHTVDVAKRDDVRRLSELVHQRVEAIDILVNNAGVGLVADVLSLGLEDWDWIVSTNLWGPIHMVHDFVPRMVRRGKGGHVVNVSSVLGFLVAPRMIGYATTKFGLLGFSEALREDLRPHGIGVSTVCPGAVRTDIVGSARFLGSPDANAARERARAVYGRWAHEPEEVARAIIRSIEKNQGLVPVSLEAWVLYYVSRAWPGLGRRLGRFIANVMLDSRSPLEP